MGLDDFVTAGGEEAVKKCVTCGKTQKFLYVSRKKNPPNIQHVVDAAKVCWDCFEKEKV